MGCGCLILFRSLAMLGQQRRLVASCHLAIGEKERRKKSRNNKRNLWFLFCFANSIRTRYKSKLMTILVCGKLKFFFPHFYFIEFYSSLSLTLCTTSTFNLISIAFCIILEMCYFNITLQTHSLTCATFHQFCYTVKTYIFFHMWIYWFLQPYQCNRS